MSGEARPTGLQRGLEAWPEITSTLAKFDKLRAQEQRIIEKYDGDELAAYSELEPIGIAMVDHMQPDLEAAFKPCLREFAATHILCAASLESHINARAHGMLRGQVLDHFDKLSLEAKWLFLPRLTGHTIFDPGAEPFQSFSQLTKRRNLLVHFKPRRTELEIGKIPEFVGKLGLTRKTAEAVIPTTKAMIEELCRGLGESAPEWLTKTPFDYFEFQIELR